MVSRKKLLPLYRCGTKKNLHPAVVKVGERKKLWLTTQRFIYYLPFVGNCREKEWKYRPCQLDKQKWHILVWNESRHIFWFFFLIFSCISNMLFRWVVSSLSPFWSAPPKMMLVNFCLFTSSQLWFNCMILPPHVSPFTAPQIPGRLLPSVYCQRDEHQLALALHMRYRSF